MYLEELAKADKLDKVKHVGEIYFDFYPLEERLFSSNVISVMGIMTTGF